jgi:hypothetical protein
MLLSACSRSERTKSTKSTKSTATVDEPWSHAYSGTADGWWMNWDAALHGNAPFGIRTQFERQTIGLGGVTHSEVLEVTSITAQPGGSFELVLQSSDGTSQRLSMPPRLLYSPGARGFITTRNEKLLPVTVPAGTFAAGRLWTAERHGSLVYERDDWVVPDLPMPVQSWSRPVSAKELYNPPTEGVVPEGAILTRLVRIERR